MFTQINTYINEIESFKVIALPKGKIIFNRK